ncbi:MAG: helix-turn-helix transcriptional regulator [Bacteroidetes bacterium]|nr:helix-turn-helix transcriptional regulator [Bacteroidota bacterium]MBT6686008.1 helix-turn-helix transcriptional regulator [Bacteroidota bacterium]MBT7143790.1 helix-turn-helix transcriptional regulator [Bacteroidota bacterium]MBT7490889.1 helix-turn-helix transcriptional regulator [Bacteroidota bacterium]
MKPSYEKVSPEFGSSVLVKKHSEQIVVNQAYWHFHPEIELVFIYKGKGKVHIGNHLSYFNSSRLLLLGANLPHHGFSDRLTSKGSETIVQFKPDFLGLSFLNLPEMKAISLLFERAKRGVMYKSETLKEIGSKIQNLLSCEGFDRLLLLLQILHELASAEDYTLLNADGFAFETSPQDSAKIDIIFRYINQNFEKQIPLAEIADEASMTVPAFCRYFKKSTGKTFTKLVNEYRVVHATKLLSESSSSITDICFECGFNNFSHFNKLFKEFTGKSASKYRNEMKRFVQ